jgi:hypothetical protein
MANDLIEVINESISSKQVEIITIKKIKELLKEGNFTDLIELIQTRKTKNIKRYETNIKLDSIVEICVLTKEYNSYYSYNTNKKNEMIYLNNRNLYFNNQKFYNFEYFFGNQPLFYKDYSSFPIDENIDQFNLTLVFRDLKKSLGAK